MIKRKITFYHTDHHEFYICKILANFAKKNGFDFQFTNNLNKKSDIGFYCLDSNFISKVNSNLSIITLGGLDQGKLLWPNMWQKENWNKFDIGFLPGNELKKKWELSSWDINSRPKISMNLIGWPKTEELFNNKKKIELLKKKIKKKIKFRKKKTIIYAPGREVYNKAFDVINAAKKLNYNLIIKQFAWSKKNQKEKFKDLRKNIKTSNMYAKKILKKDVYIVDPTENIMNYYSHADLLITDESSVIYEALLFDLPSLSVLDWLMAQNNTGKTRLPKIDTNVSYTCLQKNLSYKIKQIFTNYSTYKKKIIKKKYQHFSYLDKSCENFYKLLDININLKENNFIIEPKYRINYIKIYIRRITLLFKKIKNMIGINLFT